MEVTEWMKTHVEKDILGAEDHTHIQTTCGIPGIVMSKTFKTSPHVISLLTFR